MKREPGLTRRAVLLGTLAVPLAGCRPRHPHRPAITAADNPDRVALLEALGVEQQLLGLGEAELSRDDPDVIAHTEHVAALRAALGAPGTTSPQPSLTPATGRRRAAFDAAVAATVPRLRSLAVSAERGSTAAVLASIAANHGAPPPIRFHGQWYGARS